MVDLIRTVSILLTFSIISIPVWNYVNAQSITENDIDFIIEKQIMPVEKHISHIKNETKTELKLLAYGLIKGYQNLISTQDKPACAFTLSCSKFAHKAIKEKGTIIGIILTCDRLTRCSDLGKEYYPIDPVTGKAQDSIIKYEFEPSNNHE